MCKLMRRIEEDFEFLSYEYKEKIKRMMCSNLCGGNCKDKYLEKREK